MLDEAVTDAIVKYAFGGGWCSESVIQFGGDYDEDERGLSDNKETQTWVPVKFLLPVLFAA